MKNHWKLMCVVIVLAFVIGACSPAIAPPNPAATNAPAVVDLPAQPITAAQGEAEVQPIQMPLLEEQTSALQHPKVIAVPVDTLPIIDADASDEQWKDAPKTQIGGMNWQVVYTDTDIAMLLKWVDRDFNMDTPGTYIWDPVNSSWSQTETSGNTKREWMNLSFDISSDNVATEGCSAFCHEDPPGSGIFHHQTAPGAGRVDSWMFFEKHGFMQKKGEGGLEDGSHYGLKEGAEDRFWFAGTILAKQDGPLIFEQTNEQNSNNVIAGSVTFIDYAEDNVIVSPDDDIDANRDRTRDFYCINCHAQINLPYDPLKTNLTFPDLGEIKYQQNYTIPYTSPSYMETDPIDFVDTMIITQDEIDNGEAVAVNSLTPEQISQYWEKYAALNGKVPTLVLKTPTESMADVLVASNWKNGVWTMEITRKLVTPYPEEDVSFDDLNKVYPFSLTISNADLLLGPLLGDYGGLLEFRQ
ncbi:MAG: hypothetical protein BGO78_07425 [Chloroflexi bacterium 44-23]|nr:MAG: hypothetical protein BGO78_07425 [Chloroflexi bacterium 44-23]